MYERTRIRIDNIARSALSKMITSFVLCGKQETRWTGRATRANALGIQRTSNDGSSVSHDLRLLEEPWVLKTISEIALGTCENERFNSLQK